jgi:F-type H+-transporting ATPase subunit b
MSTAATNIDVPEASEASMPTIDLAARRQPISSALLYALPSVFAVLLMAAFAGTAQASGGGDDHNPLMETIWQGVNLALVLGLIIYFGRGPISKYFSSRRDGIKTELTDAANLLNKAEQRNAELQRRLVDLASEVEDIRESASRRADEEAERILADARATAERIRRDAQAAVGQELRRAQAELRDEAADLALEMAARKLDENVGDGDRERLMDEFITRIEPATGEGANG